MPDRYAHCSFCGARFAPGDKWPRHCAACYHPFPRREELLNHG